MTRKARYGLAIGLTLALACTEQSSAARTSKREPLVIPVAIHNYAAVPPVILAGAQSTATRIYEQAGVDVLWVDPVACPTAVHVHILSRGMAERVAAGDAVLGVATVGSAMAYVLYGRVLDASLRFHLHPSRLLGYVMSHEIGHLLLPGRMHGRAGLMRADVSLRLIERDAPQFTLPEATLIRTSGLVERVSPHPKCSATPTASSTSAASGNGGSG
jgi:hypothetical protein